MTTHLHPEISCDDCYVKLRLPAGQANPCGCGCTCRGRFDAVQLDGMTSADDQPIEYTRTEQEALDVAQHVDDVQLHELVIVGDEDEDSGVPAYARCTCGGWEWERPVDDIHADTLPGAGRSHLLDSLRVSF